MAFVVVSWTALAAWPNACACEPPGCHQGPPEAAGSVLSHCFHADPFSILESERSWRWVGGNPLNFSGQGVEDRCIFSTFFSKGGRPPLVRDGTFVELGALNGNAFSNTLFFQRALGWNGLLIEAQPEEYALLSASGRCTGNTSSLPRHKHKGAAVTCINAAVCASPVPLEFVVHGPSGGLLSHGRQGKRQHKIMEKRARDHKRVRVHCRRLDELLRENHVQSIDFFSLDVEGAEETVLKTLAGSPVRVGVVLVEDATERVCQMLRGRGMAQVAARVGYGGKNSIWASPPEAARFERAVRRPSRPT